MFEIELFCEGPLLDILYSAEPLFFHGVKRCLMNPVFSTMQGAWPCENAINGLVAYPSTDILLYVIS